LKERLGLLIEGDLGVRGGRAGGRDRRGPVDIAVVIDPVALAGGEIVELSGFAMELRELARVPVEGLAGALAGAAEALTSSSILTAAPAKLVAPSPVQWPGAVRLLAVRSTSPLSLPRALMTLWRLAAAPEIVSGSPGNLIAGLPG